MAAGQAAGEIGVSENEPAAGAGTRHPGTVSEKENALTLRKCTSLEEMQACFALHREVWSYSDADLIPVRLFVVASKIGGQVMGAFDGKELAGFALALPAMRNGHSYLHSQMLAVRPQYRNAGLGRRLKLFQRDDALARGIELMEWTFDPLEIKNAYLNIEKLSVIVRRYSVNQYGDSSSPLQGGLPTDRLTAEWWMNSKRVQSVMTGGRRPAFESKIQIDVPAEIYAWKADAATRSKALAVQERNREQFIRAFACGLSVLGYERDARGDGRFLLGSWDEPLVY
ncbi:MAG: GNAT family N-acetyltransferase [Terriglobales bacterium]